MGEVVFSCRDIEGILPHRHPFLLIDRIVEFVENEKIVGLKNVTFNEPFFPGHFPSTPVMPGVLILEAMAQTSAVLACKSRNGPPPGAQLYLVGANDVKWRRPVVPGDTLLIEMTLLKVRRPLWIMNGKVTVDGQVVATGSISAAEVNQ